MAKPSEGTPKNWHNRWHTFTHAKKMWSICRSTLAALVLSTQLSCPPLHFRLQHRRTWG